MSGNDTFLSRAEIEHLTGYVRARCQIEWLTRNGVKHYVPKTGRPVVPRSAIDGNPKPDDDGGFVLGHVA